MSKPIEVFLVTPETSPPTSLDPAFPATTRIKGLAHAIYSAGGVIINRSFLNVDTFQRAINLDDSKYRYEGMNANLRRSDIAMGILSHGDQRSAEFVENALESGKPTMLFQLARTYFPILLRQARVIPYEDLDDLSAKVRLEFDRIRERRYGR